MNRVLTQAEVDELLMGMSGGAVKPKTDESKKKKDVYDFKKQHISVDGKFPSIEMIYDKFGKGFRVTLSNLLRLSADVNVDSIKAENFGEFIQRLPIPSSLNIIRQIPLKGLSLCVIDAALVFSFVDSFFGGSGKTMKVEGREFTAIEKRVLNKIIKNLLEQLDEAWREVVPLKAELVKSEVNPQFAKVVHLNEMVLVITMNVDLDEMSGRIHFCLPFVVLEPITDRLKTNLKVDETIDRAWNDKLKRELLDVKVDMVASLGTTNVNINDIMSFQVGDVIELDRLANGMIPLGIGGSEKYHGFPGIFNNRIAIKIARIDDTKNAGGQNARP